MKQRRVKRQPIVKENNAAAILAFAALNPHASSRQMEKRVELVSDPQLMEDVPLYVRMNMWTQYDGPPPHYCLCSRQVMNEIFPKS